MEASAYEIGFRAGLRPDPILTVSEWADKHRRLSKRASAEPGQWRTSRTPYLKEPMDCLSARSPWERVVLMFGAQLGKTETGNNWIGYVIHHSPGPMLAVQPTVEMAKRNSKQRIEPLVEETPALKALVREAKSKDSSNTILQKDFPGGTLVMTGANSAVGLRSMAAGKLFLDEVDAYPGDVDGEGDPIQLAIARARTFPRRKILMTSTPTVRGESKIESAYEESDRRTFFVPCPHCDHFQVLRFAGLKWDKNAPASVRYVCESCDQPIHNHDKANMLLRGEWRSEIGPEFDGKTAGFQLSSLNSPVGWFGWEDIARQWEQAGDDLAKRKVIINTVFAETWYEKGEAPEWKRLQQRASASSYARGIVPDGALFLTAGADVQRAAGGRIEIQIIGWGRRKQSWVVDYKTLYGDPYKEEIWRQLTEVLGSTYQNFQGVQFPIAKLAIDSGDGETTNEVYNWVRNFPDRVMAVKGFGNLQSVLGKPNPQDINLQGRTITNGVYVWPVGVDLLKAELYGWLKADPPTAEEVAKGAEYPAGFRFFPADLPDEYYQQLCAEQYVMRKRPNGQTHGAWIKTGPNEALDTANYCRSAAARAGIGLDLFQEPQWAQMEQWVSASAALLLEPPDAKPVAAASMPKSNRVIGRLRNAIDQYYPEPERFDLGVLEGIKR